jgi:diacylglycerol kinase family enzyme
MLGRAAQRDMPTIAARVLLEGLRASAHRQIEHYEGIAEGRIESISRDAGGSARPFPVQVDGDYIGDRGELEIGIEPGALTIVA